jgi:membrane protease YdiL (CAAX protease family)
MQQKITKIIFTLLLVIRFADGLYLILFLNSQVSDWFVYLDNLIIYSAIIAVILLNKNRLRDMNVDQWFIVLILVTGAYLLSFNLPPSIAIIILLLMGIVAWSLMNSQLNLAPFSIEVWKLFAYIFISIVPISLIILYYVALAGIKISLDAQSILLIAFGRDILGIAFEEILFRGVLWMLLIDLKLSPRTTLLVQALLFWVSHYRFLFTGSYFSFWVLMPILGLIYGYIVYKSKSISVTSLCHWSNNFLTAILNSHI